MEYIDNETTTYEALIFSKTPSDVTVDCGETATFQTEVLSGRKPFTYRWQYLDDDDSWVDFEDTAGEKTSIAGSAQTTLTIVTSVPDITELRCVVTDSVGKEHETQTATLTVNPIVLEGEWSVIGTITNNDDKNTEDKDKEENTDNNAGSNVEDAPAELKIETQPNDASVAIDQTAKFTVEVSGGTAPYSYQWQNQVEVAGRMKWQDLGNVKGICSGAKSKTLSLASSKEVGTLLRCVITDSNGNKVRTVSVKFTVTEKKVLPSRRNISVNRTKNS